MIMIKRVAFTSRMSVFFKRILDFALRGVGFELRRISADPAPRFDASVEETIAKVWNTDITRTLTMTSPERLNAMIKAVEYIEANKIEGDIVECGVWRGGSMMASALTLQRLGSFSRYLYLFDTFDGMPPPTDADTDKFGQTAASLLATEERESSAVWAVANLECVKSNLATLDYPQNFIHFIEGTVETTIPNRAPESIAILRLDTDWYESTRHELEHLYPRLVEGGVLIIDDYGHWQGARKAVDEYIATNNIRIYLHWIDYTGRIAIKVS